MKMNSDRRSACKIVYLEPAKRDLERFREFMRGNEVSDERINYILSGVIDSIRNLEGNPRLGYSIGAKYGYTTPYRGYITDPYIVIYEVSSGLVEIRRIYHQREDYIRDTLVIEPGVQPEK